MISLLLAGALVIGLLLLWLAISIAIDGARRQQPPVD